MRSKNPANRKIILRVLLCVALLWGGISFTVFSEKSEKQDVSPNTLLGLSSASGLPLGVSGDLTISTAQELYDFSLKVNSGDELRTKHIVLTADINLMDIEEWAPIGTEEFPFAGIFQGNNFTITGIGYAPFESLFGVIKGASIQNLKVLSNKLISEDNPYAALVQRVVSSSIINCSVEFSPLTYARAMGAFANVTPDPSWMSSNTITTPGHLLDLQQQVNRGTLPAANNDIEISGTINMDGVHWVGIGDEEKPFVGTITGDKAVIMNLTSNNPGADNIGLFGYTDLSTIENIALKNANMTGNHNVGTLVGTAKRTDITGCSAEGGTVAGQEAVGGLVGVYMLGVDPGAVIVPPLLEPDDLLHNILSYSYTTNRVDGITMVGGVVGSLVEDHREIQNQGIGTKATRTAIDSCFSLGQVYGVARVGGVVGSLSAVIQTPGYIAPGGFESNSVGQGITNCASGALVSGTDGVGGIAGVLGTVTSDQGALEQCYFSGEVYGYSLVGGIVGEILAGIELHNVYTSGYVIISSTDSGETYSAVVGHYDAGLSWMSNLQAMPNTMYPANNKFNEDMTPGEHTYKYSDPMVGITFMDDASLPALTGFNRKSTAGFVASTNNDPVHLPDGTGAFPALTAFSSAPSSVQAAFNLFTEITTNPSLQTIKSVYYRTPGANGKATTTKGSTTPVSLPTVSGGQWVLSDGENAGSISLPDRTLKSEGNKVSVSGNQILIDEPMNREQELVLSLVIDEGSPLRGAKISQNVTFVDEAARSLYKGGVPASLVPTVAEMSKADKVPIGKTSLVIKYDEEINMDAQTSGSTAPLIKVTEFSDEACTVATGQSFTPNATELLGNAIKIVIDETDLNWGRYYKLELGGRAKDSAAPANDVDSVYYFSTVHNKKPVITFDDTTDLAKDPHSITDNKNKIQILNMIENSVYYRGITDGILIENEGYIDAQNIDYSFKTPPPHTMAGQGEYAGLAGNASDFYLVPGSYEVTFTVKDLEEATLVSDPITRTYRVNGTSKLTFGGKEIDLFTAELTQSDVIAAYNDKQANNLTTEQAIKNALDKKYINTTDGNKLAAYRYNYKAVQENVPIRFDTSGVTDDVFADGIDMALKFYVGDEAEARLFMFSAKLGEPEYEIRLTNTTFFTDKEFSRGEVTRNIGAYVVSRATGLPVNKRLNYSFKGLDHYNYNTPQSIRITVAETEGVQFGAKDMTVAATATVVVQKEVKYVHPKDVEDVPMTYWPATLDKLRTWRPESIQEIDIRYPAAEKTPNDFFNVVKNRDNISTALILPSGIKVSIKSRDYKNVLVPTKTYSLAVEPMYDMDVFRDAKGAPVSQFVTEAQSLPGLVTVSIPLNIYFDDGLNLYCINEETGRYNLVEAVSKNDVVDGNFIFKTTKFQGKYVITTADLDGKQTSVKLDVK